MPPRPAMSDPTPPCLVLLGRLGDVINALPIAHYYAQLTQCPVPMVVARPFVSVLDGVGYVSAETWEGDYWSTLTEAVIWARQRYRTVYCLQTGAKGLDTPRRCESFCEEAYASARMMGQRGRFPLVFDQRCAVREDALLARHDLSRPFLLHSLVSVNTAFPAASGLLSAIKRVAAPDVRLIDTNTAGAQRIHDLLALYDRAAGLVTVDTATLHLAAASRVPYIALLNDTVSTSAWYASKPLGNCVYSMRYSEVAARTEELAEVVSQLLKPRRKRTGMGQSSVTVRRTAAVGDVVASLAIAHKLHDLGFAVHWQCHPSIHPLVRRCAAVASVADPGDKCDVNLDRAYEDDPDVRKKHYNEIYIEVANRALGTAMQPLNCRPVLAIGDGECASVREHYAKLPRPWTMISPRSNSFAQRSVPVETWGRVSTMIEGTAFWIGTEPAPIGIVDLQCRTLDALCAALGCADLCVSTDTGPMHIAAALGVPLLALGQASSPDLHLSDTRDFQTLWPEGLDCLGCCLDKCPKDEVNPPCRRFAPAAIARAINHRLRSVMSTDVSAVIPIWKPPAERLNACLAAVLPQVNEVIVTADAAAVVPTGILQNPKVRVVRTLRPAIGFGRNVNYGVRQSNGRYVLVLNDDCFLNPGAVPALRQAMQPGVGVVGHLLRYPNGTIQHGGTVRFPGQHGWTHIDCGATVPTIHDVCEMENVTGASILVDRRAFYRVGAFDEDFLMYSEDAAFCLSLRQAGYKVLYTPHATGTHFEGGTTKASGRLHEFNSHGHTTFMRKWGWWILRNLYTVPGTFDL